MRVANVTVGLGYAEALHLKTQVDAIVHLLEPPAPAGRTYHPTMTSH